MTRSSKIVDLYLCLSTVTVINSCSLYHRLVLKIFFRQCAYHTLEASLTLMALVLIKTIFHQYAYHIRVASLTLMAVLKQSNQSKTNYKYVV